MLIACTGSKEVIVRRHTRRGTAVVVSVCSCCAANYLSAGVGWILCLDDATGEPANVRELEALKQRYNAN